ncbi:glycosyltransferase [Vibrio vulnificus]|nr:glycosyltransferase [Vibrio vulnificus]
MKKKICVMLPMIIPGDRINGGVPKVFINTLKGLGDAGYSVTALVHKDASGLTNEMNSISGLNILSYDFEIATLEQDFGGIGILEFAKKCLRLIASIVKIRLTINQKFDEFLVHDITGSIYCLAINAKSKVTYLHSYRSFDSKKTKILLSLITKIFCKKYISPTKSIADEMMRINSNCQISVMETPLMSKESLEKQIVSETHYPDEQSLLKLVYVGRISPVKNLQDVLWFTNELKKHNVSFHLDIFGEPMNSDQEDYLTRLKEYVSRNNLSKYVEFKGFTSDVAAAYIGNDFSLIFSDGEAIPMAGLESLLVGVPVIGYDMPGVSDLVGKNERGLLFEYRNIQEGVAILKQQLGSQSQFDIQDYVKKFTTESWVQNYMNIFSKG